MKAHLLDPEEAGEEGAMPFQSRFLTHQAGSLPFTLLQGPPTPFWDLLVVLTEQRGVFLAEGVACAEALRWEGARPI